MEILYAPWPWYIAGPVIGITVPLLLLAGNKRLGISATLRQIHAVLLPSDKSIQGYDWKKDRWNIIFVLGVALGGFFGGYLFANPNPVNLSDKTIVYLRSFGIQDITGLMPSDIFNWSSLITIKGILLMVAGGFMVGFGTRYARGCTSGHGILGLSAFQWPSLLATMSFFMGGILFSQFILPYILSL